MTGWLIKRRCVGCGHSRRIHQHYRKGTDCAYDFCTCRAFRWL